jgi:undecaprenyl-diphosphatase
LTILEGLGLGALQGLTEFLPVSSSGHLVLARELWGIEGEAAIDMVVLMHAGSLLAIAVYFRRDFLSLMTTRRRLIPWLVLGSVPAAAAYVGLKDFLEGELFDNPTAVGVAMLVTGTMLWWTERLASDRKPLEQATWLDSLLIGIAQAVAIIPGISRSGMTISTGLARGLERTAAVTFAFLLGAVAIGGATLLKGRDLLNMGAQSGWAAVTAGFLASAVVSLAALALLAFIVRRKCLRGFALYCYTVGGGVLLAKLTGLW